MERERIRACTEANLKGFFEKLVKIIEIYQLKPDQIHNMDESFVDLRIGGKVLVLKGSHYYQEIKSQGKEHITLVSTISANGKAMKHILITKGLSVPIDLELPSSMGITATENGWIDSKVKENWFKMFVEYIGNKNKPEEECKIHLLLLDGHESNWNDEMIKMAREHGVIILQFPPHTTHVLQPLDANFFHKFKIEVRKAKSTDAYRKIKDKWDIIPFLESPLYCASNPQTIKDPFRIAGVHPPSFKEECIVERLNLNDFLQQKVNTYSKKTECERETLYK